MIICVINMLNYLFHLMFWPDKDIKTLNNIAMFKYYLIHEKECFIIFKTRGAAERFRYDKTRLFECIKLLQIRRIVMLNRM